MFDWLKNHPFAVDAHFERSTVLTFALPAAQLRLLLPQCLELDTWEDTWGFVAVAMVQTEELRPSGLPRWLGQNFFLLGYRVFVRFTTAAGKRLRGLYILRSETDQRLMERMGNIFTHYNYKTTDITQHRQGSIATISSQKSDFEVVLDESASATDLPAQSPFATWVQARRFAGPLPFTFTYEAEKRRVLIIEGRRENWEPQPLHVLSQRFGQLAGLVGPGAVLASAFTVRDIPYHWRKGRFEQWNS